MNKSLIEKIMLHIENVKFEGVSDYLNLENLNTLSFNIEKLYFINFKNLILNNSIYRKLKFKNCNFYNCKFNSLEMLLFEFENCNFIDSVFLENQINNSSFNKCKFFNCYMVNNHFNNNVFDNFIFENNTFKFNIFEKNIFKQINFNYNVIKNTKIKDSNIFTNILLKENFIENNEFYLIGDKIELILNTFINNIIKLNFKKENAEYNNFIANQYIKIKNDKINFNTSSYFQFIFNNILISLEEEKYKIFFILNNLTEKEAINKLKNNNLFIELSKKDLLMIFNIYKYLIEHYKSIKNYLLKLSLKNSLNTNEENIFNLYLEIEEFFENKSNERTELKININKDKLKEYFYKIKIKEINDNDFYTKEFIFLLLFLKKFKKFIII